MFHSVGANLPGKLLISRLKLLIPRRNTRSAALFIGRIIRVFWLSFGISRAGMAFAVFESRVFEFVG